MNSEPKITTLIITRHEKLPDCSYRPLQHIRIYRKWHTENYYIDTLEMLYEDSNKNLVWAPVPVVEE